MAVSSAYRRSAKNRTRRSGRAEVVLFFFFMAMALADAGEPWRWSSLGARIFPYAMVVGRVFRMWQWQRIITVTSLDDRAMVDYGIGFERTTAAQQKDLLARYRVGTYLLGYFPDELEEARERDSYQRAYAVLRVLLPAIAVVYWVGWKLLPPCYLRDAWTDGPVVMAWLLLLVVALPQIIRMWTEPDDPVDANLYVAAEKKLDATHATRRMRHFR
jgi:hypothetical protein